MKRPIAASGAAVICLTAPIWAQPVPIPPTEAFPFAERAYLIEPVAPPPPGATVLSEQEVEPAMKALAGEIALALTTYDQNEEVRDIAARLAPLTGPEASGLAGTLHHPGQWSRGRIVYPQLGGLTVDRASVMVVVEQMIGAPDTVMVEIRTLDIRMARHGDGWRFDQLASDGGTPLLPPPRLRPEAVAVLNDTRIELPDSARWDIFAGEISPRLLAVMSRMAEATPFGVVTLMSGHPWAVFGTDRMSDHSRGLAVDVYRIGDRLVVEDRVSDSPTQDLVAWLYEQPEVARLGSPWALDGFGGRSFTDAVHQDHLHIAVYPD